MAEKIKVLVADDHPIFRSGLRMMIETAADVTLVGEAENGERALSVIRDQQPDIAVLDLDMPIKDGFEVALALREHKLSSKVIFLTAHKSESLFNKAFDSGAQGYVLKDSAITEILDSIRTVNAGQSYISPQLSTFLLNRRKRSDALVEEKPTLESLTPAERQVLRMVAHEKTSREIANELCISIRTVEHHRANICLKLGLRGSNTLIKFAVGNRSELS
jgi:DNA-binding NarL/FixJ family response regulator